MTMTIMSMIAMNRVDDNENENHLRANFGNAHICIKICICE
jgi:hypothetical protein